MESGTCDAELLRVQVKGYRSGQILQFISEFLGHVVLFALLEKTK